MPISKRNVSASAFQPENLQFGALRRYESKQQPYVPVTYTSVENGHTVSSILLLETPSMPMPFGANEYEGEKNIDLSFNNPTPEVQSFREKMEAVDGLVLQAAQTHTEGLFRQVRSLEVLKDAQNKIVKQAMKQEYGYSMRVKWPKYDKPRFWKVKPNTNKFVEIQEDDCKAGCTGKVIMELRPVYAVSGRFGVKWVIAQVLVETFPAALSQCGFGEVAEEGDKTVDSKTVDIKAGDEADLDNMEYDSD